MQCVCVCVCAALDRRATRHTCRLNNQAINQSRFLTKPHTGKEKPHPSTATEGSKPCVTKCRRLGGL